MIPHILNLSIFHLGPLNILKIYALFPIHVYNLTILLLFEKIFSLESIFVPLIHITSNKTIM